MPRGKKEPGRPIDAAPVAGGVYVNAGGEGYHNAHGEACDAKGKVLKEGPPVAPVGPGDPELAEGGGETEGEGDGGEGE